MKISSPKKKILKLSTFVHLRKSTRTLSSIFRNLVNTIYSRIFLRNPAYVDKPQELYQIFRS